MIQPSSEFLSSIDRESSFDLRWVDWRLWIDLLRMREKKREVSRRNPSNPHSSNWNIPIPRNSLEVRAVLRFKGEKKNPFRSRWIVQSGKYLLHEFSAASLVQLVRKRRTKRETDGDAFSVPLTSYFLDLSSLIINDSHRRLNTSNGSPSKCNGRLAKSYLKLMQSMWIKPVDRRERFALFR